MKNYQKIIQQEFLQAQNVLQSFTSNPENFKDIVTIAEVISNAFKNGNKIISCGNGGSHCDAMHFAEELTGRYRENRKALPAIAISDPSHLSCVGNDFGFEFVFSRFIEALGNSGDVVLGISTSGNSVNILNAFETAKKKNMTTVLLTGKDGKKLAAVADYKICVPHEGFADRIQEVHIKIIHSLILTIESMVQE
ncbi:D-sedoheptulose 7-phosphate isomerase [Mariniflexile sp.]|uniref:D-sedoheptulose 7-phosphate isomerase n=1 Tax=Mariniflexile sp. TaxID=1979402 RepID=UPI004047EBEC